MLEPASDRPINLNFPQPKPIKQIYQSLALAAGINVIFDPQLKDDNVAIVLTNISFQTALETLMRQENHFYKVIDEKTMLIAADTPQNRKTYEDLVIRTFFLSNGDVTEVSNALRSLLQTTRISINKAENSITLRDTADKVAIAEKIIEQNDKQLAEVVIDVELLQINTTKAHGHRAASLPVQRRRRRPGSRRHDGPRSDDRRDHRDEHGPFTWDQLRSLSIRSFGFNIPSVTYNFIKNNTDSELLAKPQLRISEGQKAQLVIGDKIPIPTTTFNTANVVGGSIVPVTSFQYQDVGIKIEVEPRVHHNKEVTLKLVARGLAARRSRSTFGGQSQPTIGTRTISSNIRLKDGETNFLAGLFRTDKTQPNDDGPVPRRHPDPRPALLGQEPTSTQTTDLVLTLTPHIIRIPDVTEEDLIPVYVGTDANISFQGTPRIESPAGAGPFDFRREPPAPRSAPPERAPAAPGAAEPRAVRAAERPLPVAARRACPRSRRPGRRSPAAGGDRRPRAPTVAGVGRRDELRPERARLRLRPGDDRARARRAALHARARHRPGRRGEHVGRRSASTRPSCRWSRVRSILPDGGVVGLARRAGPGPLIQIPNPVSISGTRAIAEIVLQGVKRRPVEARVRAGGSSASFARRRWRSDDPHVRAGGPAALARTASARPRLPRGRSASVDVGARLHGRRARRRRGDDRRS